MIENEILGYANGAPIFEVPEGTITTRAFVLCSECGKGIRSCGGPIADALCLKCWTSHQKPALLSHEIGVEIAVLELCSENGPGLDAYLCRLMAARLKRVSDALKEKGL